MDIVNRLKRYMEHVELPISQFADYALIPRPTLSQILSGRNKKISNELMSKLHTAFPKLNISWLLFGDGAMEIGGEFDNGSTPYAASDTVRVGKSPQPKSSDQGGLFDGIDEEDTTPQIIDTIKQQATAVNSKTETAPMQHMAISPDASKKVQSIMVFYSDNSFEIFTPAQR